MELTEQQQDKVNRLLEAERRGLLSDRPDLEKRLSVMRERGIVQPNEFQMADTSPLPYDPNEKFKRDVRLSVAGGVPPIDDVEEETRKARAEAGIAEDQLESFDNFKLGLSLNPQKELKGILDKRYNADIPVRYDRNTGVYQYVNPETNRITNVGAEGLDIGDIAKGAGESPTLIGDIAGTTAGGLITKNPYGVIATESGGSAVGTYIGELTKLALGKLVGVNQEVSFEQMHDSALKKAGLSGASTAVIGKIMQLGKHAVNFVQGRTFTKEAALRSGLQSEEADEALRQVNQILESSGSGKRVQLTTAKRSGDPIMLGDEAAVRREKDFVRDFVERDKQDQEALTEAFDAISPSRSGGANQVTQKFGTDKNARMAKVNDALENSARNLEEQLNSITPAANVDSGTIVRSAITDKTKVVNQRVNAVNNQWKRLAGFNQKTGKSQVQIPVGEDTLRVLGQLNQEARDAIYVATKSDRTNLFNFPEEEPSILSKFLLPDSVRKTLNLGSPGKKPVDLMDYQRAISDLRTTIRYADKGESVSKGQVAVLKRALGALVRDRDNYLRINGRDDLFFAINSADRFTADARNMLDRSMVGDLMRKQGNRYKVRSQDVFDTGFTRGGVEQSQEIFRVLNDNPEALNAWRTEILNKYRSEVFKEGKTTKATVSAHNKFMDDYRGAMRPFFTREEMAQIDKVGGLVKVVEKQEIQSKRLLKALNGTGTVEGSGGRNVTARTRNTLSSLDPEEVVPWLITNPNKGPGRARRTVKLLQSQPAVLEGIRAEARLNFKNKVMPDGRTLDANEFNNNLRKNAQTYRALFGDQYVDDLFKINDVLQLSRRSGGTLKEKESVGIETAVARATVAPPLTREGRMLTAFMRFRGKTARQAIARGLLNPEDLHEIARLSVLSKTSREASELAGSLGLLEYIDSDLEEQ